jgi:hypothetical protein
VFVSDRDLVVAVILGVLLPALFDRPAFLEDGRWREHTRLRLAYAYTLFAFAAAGFVYVTAVELLRPTHGFSPLAARALNGAGLIVVALLGVHHVPPVISHRHGSVQRIAIVAVAIIFGLMIGGFFAVDALGSSHPATSPLAVGSWMVAALGSYGAACWFSGLSPSARLVLYRLRRKRRQRARR